MNDTNTMTDLDETELEQVDGGLTRCELANYLDDAADLMFGRVVGEVWKLFF